MAVVHDIQKMTSAVPVTRPPDQGTHPRARGLDYSIRPILARALCREDRRATDVLHRLRAKPYQP